MHAASCETALYPQTFLEGSKENKRSLSMLRGLVLRTLRGGERGRLGAALTSMPRPLAASSNAAKSTSSSSPSPTSSDTPSSWKKAAAASVPPPPPHPTEPPPSLASKLAKVVVATQDTGSPSFASSKVSSPSSATSPAPGGGSDGKKKLGSSEEEEESSSSSSSSSSSTPPIFVEVPTFDEAPQPKTLAEALANARGGAAGGDGGRPGRRPSAAATALPATALRRLLLRQGGAALRSAKNQELVEAAEVLAEAHRHRRGKASSLRPTPSFAAGGSSAADATFSPRGGRDEGTASVEALAAEVATRAARARFSAPTPPGRGGVGAGEGGPLEPPPEAGHRPGRERGLERRRRRRRREEEEGRCSCCRRRRSPSRGARASCRGLLAPGSAR